MARSRDRSEKSPLMTSPAYFDVVELMKDEIEIRWEESREETGTIMHAEPGMLQAVKSTARGHGEQTVIPDDCEFGDNDLCYVED